MERKVFKFRLEPTAGQTRLLNDIAGARRFVYNWGLARCQQHYKQTGKGISWKTLSEDFTALKRQAGFEWLKDCDSQALQQALADLKRAFINFFEKRARYPRFKRRKDARQSFRIPQRVKVEGGRIYVPKVGWVKMRQSQPVDSPTKSATFKRDCGNWFVCLVAEFALPERTAPKVRLEDIAGGDVGLNAFLTLSDETEIDNPRFYRKAARKLRRAQRRLSRRQTGSRNRARARIAVAKTHQAVSNKRADFTHKLSLFLIHNFLALSFESLNTRGLAEHLNLSPTPKIGFAFRDAWNAALPQQCIQSTLRDAKFFNQLRTTFTLRVSFANFFSLCRSQFATLFGRQLNIRVHPAFVTVQLTSHQSQYTASFQVVLLCELCRIQELTQQSIRREQATRFVRSPNRHTVSSPRFWRLKLPFSRTAELPSGAGREFYSLIRGSGGANIEQLHTRCNRFVKNLLLQFIAKFSIGFHCMHLKNKSISAIFVPRRLKMRVAVSSFPQFAFMLVKSLWDVLALPDINRVIGCTSNSINAPFHTIQYNTNLTELAKSVLDAAWGMFFRACEYKGRWCNRHVVFVGQYFPSTKLCSECGHIKGNLRLADREWDCPVCGSHHRRDVNAAKNLQREGFRLLLAAGHAESQNACGADVRLVTASCPR